LEQIFTSVGGKTIMKVLIFGCGFIGLPLAVRLAASGNTVHAVTRSHAKAATLNGLGMHAIEADWMNKRSLSKIPPADYVLVAVGFDRNSSHSQFETYVEGLRNALDFIPESAKLVYCSSTGVYHQNDASWVDETSPARPDREGGKAHLAAEQLLWRRRPTAPTVILRLAGLYGKGRVPRIADLREGKPLPAASNGWLNLIHGEDVGSAILAAWQHPSPRRLYVVADGNPVKRCEYYREASRLARAPEPQFVETPASSSRSQRATSQKRVWAKRFRWDLVPRLRFPSYREGLAEALK
jgi:nucleoside-diphosphate-sugar epimerase